MRDWQLTQIGEKDSNIHIRKIKNTGRITLNRPKALNALTYDMACAIDDALDQWIAEDEVSLIVIDAIDEKAFCAGGDIAELYNSGKADDFEFGRKFWAGEYRLNAKIASLAIPYVAIMDGIVMGGGVGISAHGSDRIVTSRSLIAMPECGIGLVPDVGGSLILANAPGHLGEYLAMSGYRMNAGDAVLAGFADFQVDEDQLEAMKQALEDVGELSVLGEFARPADAPLLGEHVEAINHHFSHESALECVRSLETEGSEWAQKTARAIRRACPLSVASTFKIIRRVRQNPTMSNALENEYRFSFRSMSQGDLMEGIRAQIVDKDREPKWQVARLEDLTNGQIEQMLAPLDNFEGKNRELDLGELASS